MPPVRPVNPPADREPAGKPKAVATYEGHANPAFSWTGPEDWIPRWRGFIVFGAVLALEGAALWSVIAGITSGYVPKFAGIEFAIAIFAGLSGLTAMFVGFAEESVALFAAALTGIAVPFFSPLTPTAPGGPAGVDLVVIAAMLATGAASIVGGALGMVWSYRQLAKEDRASESEGPGRSDRARPSRSE